MVLPRPLASPGPWISMRSRPSPKTGPCTSGPSPPALACGCSPPWSLTQRAHARGSRRSPPTARCSVPRPGRAASTPPPPVELLHDFHTELLDLNLQDRHSDQERLYEDDTPPQEAYTLLLTRGWNHQVKTDGTQCFRDPESLGVVQHRYATTIHPDSPTWSPWGGYPSEPYWRARFFEGTPTTLFAAFTTSLVSMEPVTRAVKDIPFHTRRHM